MLLTQALHNDEKVPLPLPPGGELAAIWSANLGQPIGCVKKFHDTLAESYTKITNEEIKREKINVSEMNFPCKF